MNTPVKISVVSYLNSLPFIYGLKHWKGAIPIDLQMDIPSICAEKLISGNADVGLIPVAVLKQLSNYEIISDYCIGATGAVTSVLLLSDVPLHEIKTILLDYQSRTSVMLTRILSREFWKINVEWEQTSADYEKSISGTKAGVVIGDRALELRGKYKFEYDLSAEWQKMTGLPFVFAAWVTTKKLTPEFIAEFNTALRFGFESLEQVVEEISSHPLGKEKIEEYIRSHIDYTLDDKKKEALQRFLSLIY